MLKPHIVLAMHTLFSITVITDNAEYIQYNVTAVINSATFWVANRLKARLTGECNDEKKFVGTGIVGNEC